MARQVVEEIGIGWEDDHVALAHDLLVRLQAAAEREELRVLVERVGVDLDRLGITLAARAGGRLLGVGDDDDPLAVGAGPDLGALLVPLRPVPVGLARPLRLHPRKDALLDLFG